MKWVTHLRLTTLLTLVLLFVTACAERKWTPSPRIIGRPGADVFKLPLEAGMQDEVLELKDGRFRCWFSSDVVGRNPPKYPIEGDYKYEGDHCSSAMVRFSPSAPPLESHPVSLKPFFTPEEWAESREAVRRLERQRTGAKDGSQNLPGGI